MKIISQIIILVLLLTGGYFGWQHKDQLPFIGASEEKASSGKRKRGGRAPLVITAPVQLRDLRRTVTAVGTLQAKDSIDVTAKVTAKILKIHFSEGAVAQTGETLITLDSTEPRAQLAESRAELINSRKLYERTLKLYRSGNSPKARVDLLLSEMQIAEAKVAAGKARLNDFVIKAPFSGRLGFKEVSIGALVRPGDRITTLDNISQLQLDFDLPESHLANVRSGQTFQAVSVAYPEKQFGGTVQTISTRIDPVIRSVRIRGFLQNPDGLL
ncbi:MAG: efflux RND transporter periplasmic adaptor subunit, partial [Sneathiellales bacterium]|nr:efflux RND transporter periplasmic adaptor subunit [Sneathiellales bacterium]